MKRDWQRKFKFQFLGVCRRFDRPTLNLLDKLSVYLAKQTVFFTKNSYLTTITNIFQIFILRNIAKGERIEIGRIQSQRLNVKRLNTVLTSILLQVGANISKT